jgi:hypothetical protein
VLASAQWWKSSGAILLAMFAARGNLGELAIQLLWSNGSKIT